MQVPGVHCESLLQRRCACGAVQNCSVGPFVHSPSPSTGAVSAHSKTPGVVVSSVQLEALVASPCRVHTEEGQAELMVHAAPTFGPLMHLRPPQMGPIGPGG